jgi:hypothetical protein
MLQCVINGPPNKRKCSTVLVRCKPCHYSLPARDKSQSQNGRGRWPDKFVRSSRKFCSVGEISDGPMDSGPASLVVCSLLTSSDLERSAAGALGTLSLALLGLFLPPSNFHAGTGCWPLVACPPQDSALSTPGYLDNTHRPDHSSKS